MKENTIKELKSFIITFITIFGVEASTSLAVFANGDWSRPVLAALVMAAIRSLIKTLFQLLWPAKFGKSFLSQ